MADETEQTTEWWERQRDQLKTELDKLNPKLNVAEAKVGELEAKLVLLAKEKVDEASNHKQEIKTANLNRETAEAQANRYAETIAELESKVAALEESNAQLQATVGNMKIKDDALKSCLRSAESHVQCLTKAIAAGNE